LRYCGDIGPVPSSFRIIAARSFWLSPNALRAIAMALPKVISFGVIVPRTGCNTLPRQFADLRSGEGLAPSILALRARLGMVLN
jgi:hypothetical protein